VSNPINNDLTSINQSQILCPPIVPNTNGVVFDRMSDTFSFVFGNLSDTCSGKFPITKRHEYSGRGWLPEF
jgi:hypothetical protein